MSRITSTLRRALVLGGVSGLAIASQAQAATSSAPTNFTYTPGGGYCTVGFQFNATGTLDDGNGLDRIMSIGTENGSFATTREDYFVTVGTVQTISGTVPFSVYRGGLPSVAPEIAIYELNAMSAFGSRLAARATDRAQMYAAGGDCASVAVAYGYVSQPNQAPVADAGPDQTVAGGTTVTLDAAGSSDADGDPLTYVWSQTGGPAITITGANQQSAQVVVAAGTTYTFQVTVTDPDGASSSDTVQIVAQPAPNQTPVADAGPDQSVTGSTSVSLDGTGSSDPDGDPLTYSWVQTLGPGVTLSGANTATPVFTAPSATTQQTLIFDLTVSDGTAQHVDSVGVIVAASNQAPVADAGSDQSVTGSASVSLDGSGSSDPEGDPLTYSWIQTSGPSVTLSGANTATPSFTAPSATSAQQTITFELTVSDGTQQHVDTVAVLVAAAVINRAPVADAGPDQSVTGSTSVSLDGSGSSDPEGDPLTYSWVQTFGPGVTLSGANTATPGFTAPTASATQQTLIFDLTVSDGMQQHVDSVAVQVAAAAINQPPVADAGPDQSVTGSASVSLDGSGSSDPEGDPLTYNWVQISGPSVTLSGANTAAPSFTAPAATSAQQTMTFELTVSDGTQQHVDTVTVDVAALSNQAPIADAGLDLNYSGYEGDLATIAGLDSRDPDGNTPLSYQWTQLSGPPVTINSPYGVSTTIVVPPSSAQYEILEFGLVVTDALGATSAQDVMQLRITYLANQNTAPVADAGPDQSLNGSANVTLDASGSSDPDGDPLTYSWVQASGPSVTLSGANTATPTFTAPAATTAQQTLSFDVTVSDGTAQHVDRVTVTIAAAPVNQPPHADAGTDDAIVPGATVALDGSGSSDPDGNSLQATWTQVSGPAVTIADAAALQTTFVAPARTSAVQTLEFDLLIDDGNGATATDRVAFTLAANTAPVADAGSDQGPLDTGDTVMLDGAGSRDPDGDALTYSWTQVSGPTVTLSDATAARPSFTAPEVAGTEDLVFELVVSDGLATSPADQVTIAVRSQGSITIIQNVVGGDATVSYTSTVPGLPTSATTNGGRAVVSASQVAAGAYTLAVGDLREDGFAVTALSCNDIDSTISLADRSIALALSPNEDLVCTVTMSHSRSAAQQAISEFVGGRNALLLANQPDLQRRIARVMGREPSAGSARIGPVPVPGSQRLPARVAVSHATTTAATSLAMARKSLRSDGSALSGLDIWAEGALLDVNVGRNSGRFAIGYLGADYLVADGILVGALVQIDDFNHDNASLDAGQAEGHGWMAGPYVTARLSEGLYVDARAAFGKSDNTVSPYDDFTDAFKTDRILLSGSALGNVPLGRGFTLWPEVGGRYIRESVQDYTDSLGILVPEHAIDQGEIAFSPRLAYDYVTDSRWTIAPYAEMEGLLTFGSDALSIVEDGLRGRVTVGVDTSAPTGLSFGLRGFYDGIGEEDLRAIGGSVAVSFGF